jgi:hypothetical protein
LVFGLIPWNSELVGDSVNIPEVVSKTLVLGRASGLVGKVTTGKTAILIKLFESTIPEDVTSIPYTASLLVYASVKDVGRPFITSNIIFFKELA